jgi:hypothetical protein
VQWAYGKFFTKRACRERACSKEVTDLTGDDFTGDKNWLLGAIFISIHTVSSYNQSPFICENKLPNENSKSEPVKKEAAATRCASSYQGVFDRLGAAPVPPNRLQTSQVKCQ